MSPALLFALVGAGLVGLGLYGLVTGVHLLRRIIALNVIGNGVFLIFVALADRVPDGQPDPVPHAMVLTGIVVAVSATAVALALMLCLGDSEGEPGEAPGGSDGV